MRYTAKEFEQLESTLDSVAMDLFLHLIVREPSPTMAELNKLYVAFRDKLHEEATLRYPDYKFKNF